MTPEQINLIQRNFDAVAPQAQTFATAFYNRLFAAQPVLRLLFPSDLTEQKKKLTTTLALAIKTLREPEKLIPVLEALGRRHALAGVRDEYYETVGTALLETLRAALGEKFTTESETAWRAMYRLVSATMKRAASEMARQPTETKTEKTKEPKMTAPPLKPVQFVLTALLVVGFNVVIAARSADFSDEFNNRERPTGAVAVSLGAPREDRDLIAAPQ